ILRKLVENSGLPVTCKIRIFPDREKTLKLVKMIEATGIKALAVHCRYRDQRPREKGHWDRFKEIVEAVSIPVIANGDVWEYEHLSRLKELSGVTAVMYARRAEANISIFRKEGPLPLMDVVKTYIRRCLETRNHHSNSKYVLMQMFVDNTKDPHYRGLVEAKNFRAVCKALEMETELDAWIESQIAKGYPTDLDSVPRKQGLAAGNEDQVVADTEKQQQGRGKRKLDQDINVAAVAAKGAGESTVSTDEPVSKKQFAGTDSTSGDGTLSHPTPVDSPQPEKGAHQENIVTLPSAGAEQVHDPNAPVAVTVAPTNS
ncbi:tRNA-dihydrouridine(20) synthase [NAD(P)+]-like, partial [Entomortierella lignicola]